MTDPSITSHPHFQSPENDATRLLTRLYAEQSHTLWKDNDHIIWLKKEALQFIHDYKKGIKAMEVVMQEGRELVRTLQVSREVLRRVHVSDLNTVRGLVPAHLLTETVHMHDPWPPTDAVQSVYDDYLAERARIRPHGVNPYADMDWLNAFAHSLLPWMNIEGREGALDEALLRDVQAALPEAENRAVLDRLRDLFGQFMAGANQDVEDSDDEDVDE